MFLSDCQPGDLLDDVYVVSGKQLSTTANGKYFIKALIGDRSTQLTARMWNATREAFNQLPESGFIYIRGRIENYQANLQLIIDGWRPAEAGTYDVADLMPTTDKNIDEMFARTLYLLGTIKSPHVAALVRAFTSDEKLMADLRRAPAAMSFHHSYVGGLLEHTLSAMEVAAVVTPLYPKLSGDLVLAGIFLHDIAKTWELIYETSFGYSDAGHLVGHIVKAAIWLESKVEAAEALYGGPIPRQVVDVLQHIILSHHGELQFGAAKTPATPEAIMVHTLENLDAKMMMSLGATREGDSQAHWTEYMKAFGGRLYRPDVSAITREDSEPPAPWPERAAAPQAPARPAPAPRADTPPGQPGVAAGETKKAELTNPLFEQGQRMPR